MLTRKQLDLLAFINKRMKKDGVPPSFDEMKEALDLRSKSGIHRLITALEERGFIRRLAHRARAIEIVKLPDSLGTNNKVTELNANFSKNSSLSFRLIIPQSRSPYASVIGMKKLSFVYDLDKPTYPKICIRFVHLYISITFESSDIYARARQTISNARPSNEQDKLYCDINHL